MATPHAWRNPGQEEVRWLELSTPQPLTPPSGREDTYFLPALEPALETVTAGYPNFHDPTTGRRGHYSGTPPQHEAFAVAGPARAEPLRAWTLLYWLIAASP